MRYLLLTFVFGVAAVLAAWMMAPSGVPSGGGSWRVRRPVSGDVVERIVDGLLATVVPVADPGVRALRGSVAEAVGRLVVLGRMSPLVALAASAAVLAGLVVRESARLALRFSSPTWNFVGKRIAASALVILLVLPLWPTPVPAWACYLVALIVSFGAFLYVANLPVKL